MVIDTTFIAERHGTNPPSKLFQNSNQSYKLYPNPNDGSLIINQTMIDKNPVVTEIWDATGSNIYKQTITFMNGQYDLRLGNFKPGIYLMQLHDSGGKQYKIKFMIE